MWSLQIQNQLIKNDKYLQIVGIRSLFIEDWRQYKHEIEQYRHGRKPFITVFEILISHQYQTIKFENIIATILHPLHNIQVVKSYNKMLNRLTNRLSNNLYVFSKKRLDTPNFLPLYQSAVFKSNNFDDIFTSSESTLRYKQILPTLLTSQSGIYPRRYLYTSLAFDPNNQVLKIVTLRAAGFHTQEILINHVIPWSYRDLSAQSKFPEPKLPPFVDDEMIYYNTALRETIFCERDGQWNEETVKHPKLSLDERYNEKEWFDRQQIF